MILESHMYSMFVNNRKTYFLVCQNTGQPVFQIKGRFQFPAVDFRPLVSVRFAEINYHEDHVNNQNGYENFLGLLHYYATRKYLIFEIDVVMSRDGQIVVRPDK